MKYSMTAPLAFASLTLAIASLGMRQTSAEPGDVAADQSDAIFLPEPEPAPPPMVVGHVPVVEKYDDGAIRVERQVVKMSDNQVINDGKFTEYYPDGQKYAEGNFVNGVHDGAWTLWHPKGQICKTVTFKMGRAEGTWDVFRPDGSMQAKRTYKNNKRDGLWTMYHDDGKTPHIEATYVDGVVEGVRRVYFANGKLQQEAIYSGNMLNGPLTEWDETGRKVLDANFKNNKRDGEFTLFRPDGETVKHTYRDGQLVVGDR
jgi:antitoxin component YwqK of YwqJK toxin-antitoxin module